MSSCSISSNLLKSKSDPVIRKKDFIVVKHLFLYTDRSQDIRIMVELGRIELPTSCVQGRRSPS